MNLIYWLLCLIIGLLPAWLVWRQDRKKNLPVSWLPALLRFLTCFLTAALLLAPAFPTKKTEEEKPVLLWLQDNSGSMRTALGKDSTVYRKKIQDLWDQWGKEYNVVPFAFGPGLDKDSLFQYRQRSTNIAAALQTAAEQYEGQNTGAIILASDGIYNEGQNPLYTPSGHALPVYSIALGDSTPPRDISVTRVYANKTVALNSTFEVITDIRAEKMQGSNTFIRLQHNGKVLSQQALRMDNERQVSSFRFEINATEKGFQQYSIVVPPAEGEFNITNNRLDFFVEVIDEQTKILILALAPHPDLGAIREALDGVPHYKTELHYGKDIPVLSDFGLIISHQLPLGAIQQQIKAQNIPVWYILGGKSNLHALSQEQSLLRLTSNGQQNEALPLLHKQFNLFSLPANINEVLAKMPPLQVPYGNYTLTDGQALLRQQIGNVSTDYPLWIIQSGDKPQALLCGEGLWRWRLYEYKHFRKHEVVDELIRQTVSLLNTRKDRRPFQVFLDKYIFSDNESIPVYAALKNPNGELVNLPAATLNLQDSAGRNLNYTFEKDGNSYRLNLGLLAPGKYRFKGSTQYNGKNHTAEGAFIVESVPLEQLRIHSDYELLYKLSGATGGAFFTFATMDQLTDSLKLNRALKPVMHVNKSYTAFIDLKWLFLLILLTATAEWLLRKYWNV